MKRLLVVLSVLFLMIPGCKKAKTIEQNLVVITDEEVVLSVDNAVINITYSYDYELQSVDVIYSRYESMSDADSVAAACDDGHISATLNNLRPKTTYYYQLDFNSGFNHMKTDVNSFTTLYKDAVPTVVTGEVVDITSTSAYCTGEVVSDGNLPIKARGLCWCFHPKPSINEGSFSVEEGGMGDFGSTMELTPNTTYYVRAYATNSKGIAYGEDRMFTTPAE